MNRLSTPEVGSLVRFYWPVALEALTTCDVSHEKAITLQGRVPPTNNLAERALRPLVVLRRITLGDRSEAGGGGSLIGNF